MPRHNQIVPRRSAQVVVQPDRALNIEVAEAERGGIAAVAHIQAAAFATSVGMSNAMMLSQAADIAFRTSPMGEDVYRSILAAYGTVAVSEIQALGLRHGGQH
jgi:hypothetical protein